MKDISNSEINSYLEITGFTINPFQNKNQLKNFLYGLCNCYLENHICDFDKDLIHKNYLKKQVGEIYVQQIKFEKNESLLGFVALENGYIVVQIKTNCYPAEVYANIFLNEKILDFQIILDHFSAPYRIYKNNDMVDGMELFDLEYSIRYETKKQNKNNKHDKNIWPSTTDWTRRKKNYLKKIECYFCENSAKFSTIYHEVFLKSIFVCNNHKSILENIKSVDILNDKKYTLKEIIINEKIIGYNIESNNV